MTAVRACEHRLFGGAASIALLLALGACTGADDAGGATTSLTASSSTAPMPIPVPDPLTTASGHAGDCIVVVPGQVQCGWSRDGAQVPRELIVTIRYEAGFHCEPWVGTSELVTAASLGQPISGDARRFVRDPDGHLGDPLLASGYADAADLPHDAADTGYRQGDQEVWLAASDPDAAFVVSHGVVERWPLWFAPSACA